jgi:hypothetical protein
MLHGGCFCSRIRYEVTGIPFHETNCHCSMCRRTTGAPFVAWFSVRPSDFRLACGNPSRFRSSAKATRSFCGHCGTQLTFKAKTIPTRSTSQPAASIIPRRCLHAIIHTRAGSCPGLSCPMAWPNIHRRGQPASSPAGWEIPLGGYIRTPLSSYRPGGRRTRPGGANSHRHRASARPASGTSRA